MKLMTLIIQRAELLARSLRSLQKSSKTKGFWDSRNAKHF